MSSASGAPSSGSGSGPIRLSFAQSTAISTRSRQSSGRRRRSSASGMNEYSTGSGASPYRYMTLSLPSWSSASFSARMEPSASPSGFSWVTSKKRSRERIASATAATSLVVWGELIDQLRHADPVLDRRIVFERELWCSLKPELAREPALQNAVRRLQTRQALALLGLRSEDTHVNPRVPQVRRGLDSGDGHEADPRVLQLPDRFREHLPDRLVNAPHSVAHAPYSIGLALKAAAPHCERPAEKAHGYDGDAGRDRRPW